MRTTKMAAQVFGVVAVVVGCLSVATEAKAGDVPRWRPWWRGLPRRRSHGGNFGGGHYGGGLRSGNYGGGSYFSGYRGGFNNGGYRGGFGRGSNNGAASTEAGSTMVGSTTTGPTGG